MGVNSTLGVSRGQLSSGRHRSPFVLCDVVFGYYNATVDAISSKPGTKLQRKERQHQTLHQYLWSKCDVGK